MAEIDLKHVHKSWLPALGMALPVLLLLGLGLGFSLHNSQSLALSVEDGRLFVEKGIFLPWGSSVYHPHAAYEAVELPQGLELTLPVGDCEDLAHCEQRFYQAILTIAAALLERRQPEDLEQLRTLLVRAQLFPSINLAQRAPIEDLAGAIHYVEALVVLDEVRDRLQFARKKLQRSRISGVAGVDEQWLDALIDMLGRELEQFDAIRPALSPSIPSEAPTPPPPPPTELADEGPV